MGNTQSSEQKTSTPNSPASGRPQSVRQKDSLQSLLRTPSRQGSGSSASANDPTRANSVTSSSKPSHTRARSVTAPAPAPTTKINDPAAGQKASTSDKDDERIPPTTRASTLPTTAPSHPSVASRPVDVPTSNLEHEDIFPAGIDTEESIYGHGPSDYSRPPRLPLPIEEEVHTPGSPIISPHDLTSAVDDKDVEGTIPRRTSVLSSTTADDDEIGENETFAPDHSLAPTVPTLIEWKGKGEKVYVTGTFVMWEKKFKLHRNPKTGHFSATLALKPGTHHVKFLVDNDMITSDNLPTTVDFTNILVNYIEVAPPPTTTAEEEAQADTANHAAIAGSDVKDYEATSIDQAPTQPIPIRLGESKGDKTLATQSGSVHEPITIPSPGSRTHAAPPSPQPESEQQSKPAKHVLPQAEYTTVIPQFMLDLDRYHTPEDERYQRAYRVSSTLPTPPSLPLFLAKSILNSTTPHKDDASVLNMPNHTVLNHLATSSIKNNVLATSGTTRYKRKFLTTIMYRPT